MLEAVRSGWISNKSPFVSKLEAIWTHRNGGNALACSSGTAALWLALRTVLGNTEQGNVVIPAFTFAATAHAIQWAGAKPRIVDVDPETWCLPCVPIDHCFDYAVLPVHIFGREAFTYYRDIPVIEDCAQAITIHSPDVQASCYSFFINKSMTTGVGGLLHTKAHEIAQKAQRWRDFGKPAHATSYEHELPGMNFQMGGLQAAVGCAQLERLMELLSARRKIAERYHLAFHSGYGDWLYAVELDDRTGAMAALHREGIESRACFPSLSTLPYLESEACPVAEHLSGRILLLPVYPGLEDQEKIIEIVGQFL